MPTASRIPIHNVKEQVSGIGHQGSEELTSSPALFMFLGMARAPANKAFGGADRDRTGDPLLAKQVLSQLSYGPKVRCQIPDGQVSEALIPDTRSLSSEAGGPGKI
jgi:hypothetical protein